MNSMTQYEMNNYLQDVITPAKAMGIKLTSWEAGNVEIFAPLPLNANHAGTGFGGSISSLLLLCGWAAVKFMFRETDSEALIVVKTSTTEYLRPVTADFCARADWPPQTDIDKLIQQYTDSGRVDMNLKVRLFSGTEECAFSDNLFVIRRKK